MEILYLDLPIVMEKKTTVRDISARKHCNRSRFLSVRKETGMILCLILYYKTIVEIVIPYK
jgi:hypothetical protein